MSNKKTLVLGASQNPDRYSYLAMNRLKQKGHDVVAVGLKEAVVNGMEIVKDKKGKGALFFVSTLVAGTLLFLVTKKYKDKL